MSNKQEQMEIELTHLRNTIDEIETEMKRGRINSDGDTILSEESAIRISVLLEL